VNQTTHLADWRTNSYYPTHKPCCICGSTTLIGIEPRFNYAVCQQHSKLSPVEINKERTDGK
jgi:hypothetical protein